MSEEVKVCRVCGGVLGPENWWPSMMKSNNRLCNDCNKRQKRELYQRNEEYRNKKRQQAREYVYHRWHSDPEFRRKRKEYAQSYIAQYMKSRYHSDPEFRRRILDAQYDVCKCGNRKLRKSSVCMKCFIEGRRMQVAGNQHAC